MLPSHLLLGLIKRLIDNSWLREIGGSSGERERKRREKSGMVIKWEMPGDMEMKQKVQDRREA